MPGQVYEPLSGSPEEERPYLMQCGSRRERHLVTMTAVASLLAGLMLITAVFMHMEYSEAHQRAQELEELCVITAPPTSSDEPPAEPPCTSPGCVTAAARILGNMDPDQDPCEDFYQYACGRFPLASPRPSELATWGQFPAVSRREQTQMTSDLQSRQPDDLTGAAGNVRRVFQHCTNMTSRDLAGVTPLVGALERVGGWPALATLAGEEWNGTSYSWTAATVLAHLYTGINIGSPLVQLSVSIDERNATRHLIHVDQPLLGVTRGILVDSETHEEVHAAYERLIVDTLLLLLQAGDGGPANQSVRTAAEEAATEIREFEVQLARLTVPDENRRNISRMYNKMTLSQLQQLTDQAQPNMISWTELIGQFVALGADAGPDPPFDDMEVVVLEPNFFKNLTLLLNRTDDRTVANYIGWCVAKGSLSHLNSEARQTLFNFDKVLSGKQAPGLLEKNCYDWLIPSMGPGLSYIFITKLFPEGRKDKVANMVSDVRTALSYRLNNITWMDNSTQQQAKNKVEQMVSNVAYPDWMTNATALDEYYQGFEVQSEQYANYVSLNRLEISKNVDLLPKPSDRNKYFAYPSVVNAVYEPTVNSITLPAAILAPPFYDDTLQVLNYGAIGTIIGHEITHGLDDVGSQYDAVGSLVSWWSAATRAEFTRRADCMVQQYSNYSLPGLQALLNDSHVNGRQTLGENIADNGGLARAYEAYFEQYVSRHGPEPALPALSQLTTHQLFFIAFAQSWCTSQTPEYQRSQLLMDAHSPQSVRVRGAVSNSAAFSAAFSCPRGAPMNPEHKCVVW